MKEVLRWVLIIISIPLLVALVLHTIRRARALSERIDEYKEEQEAQSKQPGPINPYAEFGRLMGVDEKNEEDRERRE